MSTQTTIAAPARKGRHLTPDYIQQGLPDPRPVTDYTVSLSTFGGHSRITVTLGQPCVVKLPMWPLIDCTDGSLVNPTACTPVSNTVFLLDYAGLIGDAVAFVQVPFQDTQVQNFQGGFVRPGGQWFRKPS